MPAHMSRRVTFYRAMSFDEYNFWTRKRAIDSGKAWGYTPRIRERLREWVRRGYGAPTHSYDVLVSVDAPIGEFDKDSLERGVYNNRSTISVDRLREELRRSAND